MEAVSTKYKDLKRLYEQKEALSKELEEAMEVWLGLIWIKRIDGNSLAIKHGKVMKKRHFASGLMLVLTVFTYYGLYSSIKNAVFVT